MRRRWRASLLGSGHALGRWPGARWLAGWGSRRGHPWKGFLGARALGRCRRGTCCLGTVRDPEEGDLHGRFLRRRTRAWAALEVQQQQHGACHPSYRHGRRTRTTNVMLCLDSGLGRRLERAQRAVWRTQDRVLWEICKQRLACRKAGSDSDPSCCGGARPQGTTTWCSHCSAAYQAKARASRRAPVALQFAAAGRSACWRPPVCVFFLLELRCAALCCVRACVRASVRAACRPPPPVPLCA